MSLGTNLDDYEDFVNSLIKEKLEQRRVFDTVSLTSTGAYKIGGLTFQCRVEGGDLMAAEEMVRFEEFLDRHFCQNLSKTAGSRRMTPKNALALKSGLRLKNLSPIKKFSPILSKSTKS